MPFPHEGQPVGALRRDTPPWDRTERRQRARAEVGGIAAPDKRIELGGMNEFHAAAGEPDTRVVTF